MHFQFVALFCFCILLNVSTVDAQVELPDSVSPNKRYAVFIETDKDQANWKPKLGECVYPSMWIEDLKTQKRVCIWKSDLEEDDDMQPLRTHYKCFWAPDSQGLAFFGENRFDNGFDVYRRLADKSGTKVWAKCDDVDAFGIIEKLTPHFKYFKGRPHSVPNRWSSSIQLVFIAGDVTFTDDSYSAGNFGRDWQFTVDYRSKRPKILQVVPVGVRN